MKLFSQLSAALLLFLTPQLAQAKNAPQPSRSLSAYMTGKWRVESFTGSNDKLVKYPPGSDLVFDLRRDGGFHFYVQVKNSAPVPIKQYGGAWRTTSANALMVTTEKGKVLLNVRRMGGERLLVWYRKALYINLVRHTTPNKPPTK